MAKKPPNEKPETRGPVPCIEIEALPRCEKCGSKLRMTASHARTDSRYVERVRHYGCANRDCRGGRLRVEVVTAEAGPFESMQARNEYLRSHPITN